jgi:putative transposase
MARPHQFIEMTDQVREFLTDLVSKGKTSAREHNRARMLLFNFSGNKATDIATLLGISYVTVTQTLKYYRDEGLESALYDAHRSGAPRKVTAEIEARVTAIACSNCPEGRSKWTIDLLHAEYIRLHGEDKIGRSSVHSILKKANSNLGNIACGA